MTSATKHIEPRTTPRLGGPAWCNGLILTTMLISSCSFSLPISDAVMNDCSSDADCNDGTCDVERQMCFAASPEAPYEIAIQVTPSDDRPTFISEPRPLTEAGTRDIVVPRSVDVPGTVRWRGDRVPAELHFRRPGLSGHPPVTVRASTFSESREIEGEQADFVVRLPLGFIYEVEVRPRGTEHPEIAALWSEIIPRWSAPARLDLTESPVVEPGARLVWTSQHIDFADDVDTPCGPDANGEMRTSWCKLSGTIVSEVAGAHVPQPGLRIRAADAESQRVVSSIVETDEVGAFELFLGSLPEAWEIRVSGGDDNELFPEIAINPNLLFSDELVVQVPVPHQVQYYAALETADQTPVSGAAVTFSSTEHLLSEESSVRGSFRIMTTSDAEGQIAVTLVPGMYDVVITPADEELAVHLENVIIDPSLAANVIRGQVFEVPARSKLSGVVIANPTTPIEDVRVEAVALGQPGRDGVSAAAVHNRSSETLTLESGQFQLPLDVGTYDVFIKPPETSRFSWRVIPNYSVGRVNIDRINSGDYEVGSPVPLRGIVQSQDGAAFENAEIRAFARVAEDDRFVEIGRTETGADGVYELLLPPALD